MIQLYKKGNEKYGNNGDHVLHPTSCILDRTLNGSWELEIDLPLDEDGRFKDITTEAVIKAPVPEGDRLFYVYDTDKMSDDSLTASARPVFLNAANEVFLLDTRAVDKNGQEALDILTSGTRYTAKSNITTGNTAYYVRKNLIQAIASDDDNSFLNRWGGEIQYNDFEIVVNDRIGGDYGVRILYGKNLESIGEHCNIDDVVTRIVPVAYNGYTLAGDKPWVDSPLIDKYTHVHTKTITYSDVKLAEDATGDEEGFATLSALRAELVRRCEQEFEAGIDKPNVTLEVNMVDLSKTVEYADYKVLETVSLGDIVYCEHSGMGIVTTARVIRQKWNCILKRNEELVIGDFQYDYFDKMTSAMKSVTEVINKNGMVMAEKVSGFINGAIASLRAQYDVAKKQDVIAVLFENLEESSPLYGALAIGTQGLVISKKRTADGRSWDWTTSIDANGIIANTIVAGIIADKLGLNWWDLDTGEFVTKFAQIGNFTLKDGILQYLDKYVRVTISADTIEAGDRYGFVRINSGKVEFVEANVITDEPATYGISAGGIDFNGIYDSGGNYVVGFDSILRGYWICNDSFRIMGNLYVDGEIVSDGNITTGGRVVEAT